MWRLYGNEEGLAIKSNVTKLEKALNLTDEIVVGEVEYRDYDQFKITTDNPMAPLFYKRKAFKFENELRVLTNYVHGESNKDGVSESQPDGIPIEIDVEKLIDEIVVSPLASNDFLNDVKETTENCGYDFNIRRSEILKISITKYI